MMSLAPKEFPSLHIFVPHFTKRDVLPPRFCSPSLVGNLQFSANFSRIFAVINQCP